MVSGARRDALRLRSGQAAAFAKVTAAKGDSPINRWSNRSVLAEVAEASRGAAAFAKATAPKGVPADQKMEAPPGIEPGMEVLQTSALPLGDGALWRN